MPNIKTNQEGLIPIIFIAASVVIVALFAVIFFQFSNKSDNTKPAPSPNAASLQIPAADKDCADRDYTGCDGVEVVKWTDDGKR